MKTILFASLMTVLACEKKPAESSVEAIKEVTTEATEAAPAVEEAPAEAEAATEEAAPAEAATEEAAPAEAATEAAPAEAAPAVAE